MKRLLIALALASLTACGGSGGSGGTDPGDGNGNGSGGSSSGGSGDPVSCTVTLGGAQTGSAVCTDLALVWTSNNNTSSFGFKAVSGTDTVTAAVFFPGEPTATTYDDAVGASAVFSVINGSALWTGGVPAGTWTLTISSVSLINAVSEFKKYQVHGALAATLQPASGTDPTPVTLNATF
jgi:hypothetical protein